MTLVSREKDVEESRPGLCKNRVRVLTTFVVVAVVVSLGYMFTLFGGETKKYYLPDDESVKRKGPCKHPLTHSLRKILLAINFNHPFYRKVDILLEYYKDIFPNYVICGPVRDPRKRHDIIVIKHPVKQRGYYGFQCMTEAIKRYPDYDGYLYINDDMLVNWWNLLDLDQSRIWYGCNIKFPNAIQIGAPPHNAWWKRADSAVQCTKAFVEVEKDLINNRLAEIYNKNADGQRLCFACWSDIYYIPGHLSIFFARFGDVFYKHKVFLEASVATIMAFLDYRDRYIILEGKYLPDTYGGTINYNDGSIESPLWQEYNRKLVFIHPYKLFGGKDYEKVNTRNYRRILVNYSKEAIRERCLDPVLAEGRDNGFFKDFKY